jgi:glycosyltransferase involved in cell wall biosynthesis
MHKAHSTVIKSCASHMVAATEYIQKHALREGIQPERLVLIRSGIEPAEEIDLQLRRRLRVELDVPDDGCLVVSAGGMHSPRAYHDLLQVVPGILVEFPLTRFVFIGKGPAQTSLVQIARQLGVAAQVRFPGARPDLLRLIGAADVYVLPSAVEGIPPYLLEAMAAQRAIVASDCEQVKEFIQPGSNALTAAPGDLLSLKNAVIQLISDAELRRQIGNSAQERMRSEYNLERMCREYAVLLDPSYHVEAL